MGFEVDGWGFHASRDAFDGDRQRGNELVLEGWRIYHFMSKTTRASVVRVARSALEVDFRTDFGAIGPVRAG